MWVVLLSVLAVSTVGALLAALIVVARKYIVDYGECTITINNDETLNVTGGVSLLEALAQNKIFVPSACGGKGTCAYCKLKVLEGGGSVVPTEEPYLDTEERDTHVRLSCQVKVRNDLSIEIPDELLAIKEYACTCTRIQGLTSDIKEFRLELNEPAEIDYRPGQYVQLRSPAYDGNDSVYRAYSIASDPTDKSLIELVIRLVPDGICTTWCFEHLEEGKEVTINGPYGDFCLTDNDAPMIFVAGGSGMAPMRCMLYQMREAGDSREVTYFFGANRIDELFYEEEMTEFEESLPSFRFVPVVAEPGNDEAWDGETGLVTEAIERVIPDTSKHEGYLCGSPGMIDAAIDALKELGMSKDKIFYDKF